MAALWVRVMQSSDRCKYVDSKVAELTFGVVADFGCDVAVVDDMGICNFTCLSHPPWVRWQFVP
eukprot:839876-Amphidinium_carterae.1